MSPGKEGNIASFCHTRFSLEVMICDMIKGNESDVGKIEIEIFDK